MTILYVVIALVAVFFVVAAMQPADFTISRSTTIAAPAETSFRLVNDLHEWQTWSPWSKMDPNAKLVYEGPVAGVGAAYSWSGNKKVGTGRLAITQSNANELVQLRLDFLKPMKATNSAEFTFRTEGGRTVVNWSMSGKKNFIAKAIVMVMSCDKMIGRDFEQGLAAIKSLAEAAEKPQHAGVV